MSKSPKKLTAQEIDKAYIMIRVPETDLYVMNYEDIGDYLDTTDGELIAYRDINLKGSGTVIGRYSVVTLDVVGAGREAGTAFELFDLEQKTFDYLQALYDMKSTKTARPKFKQKVLDTINSVGPLNPGLLILDRLEIYPEFRGRGFGNQILESLIRRFGAGKNVIAMCPYPLQYEDTSNLSPDDPHDGKRIRSKNRLKLEDFKGSEKASFKKLADSYGKIGFKRVKGTDYMVKAN